MLKGKATGGSGRPLDRDQARQALTLLVDPQHDAQLFALPWASQRTLPGSDIDGLVNAAAELAAESQQVYITLNPVRDGFGTGRTRAKAADILKRRWFFIDVDPLKPDEFKDHSATQEEKEKTQTVALEIMDLLCGQGWPVPIMTDSGNGTYLLYRVDLPNTDASRAPMKRILTELKEQFAGRAIIDQSVHDAPRIAKLPGSWALKGPDKPERPHRQAKLRHVPDTVEVVQFELLTATAAGKPQKSLLKGKATPENDNRSRYVAVAFEREIARVALAPVGERNSSLNRAAYSLGQFVTGGHLRREDVEAALTRVALQAGLGERETESTIRSGLDAGIASGAREIPERNGVHRQTEPPSYDGETIIVRASAIRPQPLDWLWPGRIPVGKLTTFAGQTGQGKTFVTCDIIARITRGDSWPDGQSNSEIGQAVFISGDDDFDDTIVPRLIEMGANLSRVVFLTEKVQAEWSMAALKTLDKALDQAGDDVRIVAIDPPTSFLHGVDDHKNSELRAILTPFKDWAKRNRVAVVLITHVNKGGAAKVEAIMRVMGSVAWVTGVRAAYMFAPDPEDDTRQLFCALKNNLGPKAKAMAYRITSGADCGKVEWLGEVETTADEAMGKEKTKSRRAVASDWLIERFREKLEWRSEDLFRAASEENISRNAVFEAKQFLDLPKARRMTALGGHSTWVWWVPPDWPLLKDTTGTVGTVGTLEGNSLEI